ncbi:MAG: cytochrome c oxidase subunit I [Acidimicrobiia bacterium]|nr:cytochrome c oxidase subunit I [Acidimicrobiia bacterium]
MTTTSEPPLQLTAGVQLVRPSSSLGVLARPKGDTGWKSWLFTVDHKRIGIMYGAAALVFLVIGGIEALLIRLQLAVPGGNVLSEDAYNQVFTMHGVTMVFLVIMPMAAAFANYLLPLQIGARDVAFPRLNAFSLWAFLAGGIFLNTSWFLGGAPDGGWFGYAPNSGLVYSPSNGMDFYALGLQIAGIASLVSAINLITTVLNMRAPGMTLFRMPVLTWMLLVVQFLLLFAIPVITVALFLLTFDRLFGANFFNVAAGADPLLWQHLFWIFGHPEVYILILPAFGIMSEVIPVFSRKPIFGYPFMVFSGIAIGFMGWGVWAHHMFTSGMGPVSVAAFSLSTMFIAVPTGVKILNWLATMWGGRLRMTTAMMYSVGAVAMFTIGGLSGVTHAIAPADTQQTDTYYIVAHFHYVIFGGSLMGMLSGIYFWWPKMFGHKLDEKLGKFGFWVLLIGFNLTFGPMHILGLQGMSRRIHSYAADSGFNLWNMFATVGSFVVALGVMLFFWNIGVSRRRARAAPPVGPDPWDARGLEWMTASPTPAHNFDRDITVTRPDEFWHRKWRIGPDGEVKRIARAADVAHDGSATDVHLPSPSYWPVVVALGLPLVAYGLIYNLWITGLGALLILGGLYGWVFEPPDDPEAHDHHDDHDADGSDDSGNGASGGGASSNGDGAPADGDGARELAGVGAGLAASTTQATGAQP